MIDKKGSAITPTNDPWEDLVVSMLSVNNCSMELTYQYVDGLRNQGLFDPRKLAVLDQNVIATKLKAGGYDPGEFMNNLLASRLVNLGQFVKSKGFETCSHGLLATERYSIEQLLSSVRGVGPAARDQQFLHPSRNRTVPVIQKRLKTAHCPTESTI